MKGERFALFTGLLERLSVQHPLFSLVSLLLGSVDPLFQTQHVATRVHGLTKQKQKQKDNVSGDRFACCKNMGTKHHLLIGSTVNLCPFCLDLPGYPNGLKKKIP